MQRRVGVLWDYGGVVAGVHQAWQMEMPGCVVAGWVSGVLVSERLAVRAYSCMRGR